MKTYIWSLALACMMFLSIPSLSQAAGILLGSTVGVGSRGETVLSLQQFLASDPHIYPAGLITGYYGALTSNAVKQFQIAYGISPVGQVGPITLAAINALGLRGVALDVTAPATSNVLLAMGQSNAVFSWNTNEPTRAKVFYDTRPLIVQEAQMNFVDPSISGSVVLDSAFGNVHSLSVQNLVKNTAYYYVTLSADQAGNVNVSSQGTFTLK